MDRFDWQVRQRWAHLIMVQWRPDVAGLWALLTSYSTKKHRRWGGKNYRKLRRTRRFVTPSANTRGILLSPLQLLRASGAILEVLTNLVISVPQLNTETDVSNPPYDRQVTLLSI